MSATAPTPADEWPDPRLQAGLTPAAAARLSGVSRATVYRQVAAGDLATTGDPGRMEVSTLDALLKVHGATVAAGCPVCHDTGWVPDRRWAADVRIPCWLCGPGTSYTGTLGSGLGTALTPGRRR